MMKERRRHRTNLPGFDLSSWFDAEVGRQSLLGLVLSDEQGYVVYSGLPESVANHLAVDAPFMANVAGPTGTIYWKRYVLRMTAMIVAGDLYYLMAVSHAVVDSEAVRSAEIGVRRILNQAAWRPRAGTF